MIQLVLPFTRLDAGATLPSPAHPGDAGLDLASTVDVEVPAGEREMIPTGVAVAIPEGHAGLVLPRSGLASRHGLTLANSPGLIDSGYRGEVTCAVSYASVVNSSEGQSEFGAQTRTSMPSFAPPTRYESAMLKRASPR